VGTGARFSPPAFLSPVAVFLDTPSDILYDYIWFPAINSAYNEGLKGWRTEIAFVLSQIR